MAAEADIEHRFPLTDDALFSCQQAVEKSMKAFLTAHDTMFRRTHDLDELAIACESIDPSLAEVLLPARDLAVRVGIQISRRPCRASVGGSPGRDEIGPEGISDNFGSIARECKAMKL